MQSMNDFCGRFAIWKRPGFFALLACAILFALPQKAGAINASPEAIELRQSDGTKITLKIRGDEFFHWFEDLNGYTVVQNNGQYSYAQINAEGKLAATELLVGKVEPASEGLKKGVLPSIEIRKQRRTEMLQRSTSSPQKISGPASLSRIAALGTVKNLVILCRFSDHTVAVNGRPEADYTTLFNNNGPATVAPTGSLKDLYRENSYGIVDLESTVVAWVALPQSEAYYANGQTGFGAYPQNAQKMVEDALALVDPLIDFGQFDTDSDGYIDAIDIIHSGYAAETGGGGGDWIWSHKWSLPLDYVTGDNNANGVPVKVSDYHTEAALWGTSGNQILRIGVIAHETGHFFGLPDLYDTDGGGEGIGSYCMMANSWGFDGTQLHPPHFSAWSKITLGWVNPTVISPGVYSAPMVESTPTVFKITQGFPVNEYLLIENRQPFGFESAMPQGGIAIWHIDDNKNPFGNQDNTDEGYPGQPGWPGNGSHYRIALLQADGRYGLERGQNRGDSGDLYRGAGGVNTLNGTTIPNTATYQGGIIAQTGIQIASIDPTGNTMNFTYTGPGGPIGDVVQFDSPIYTVNENIPGFVTVVVTNTSGTAGSVNYATSDGTALAGTDYLSRSGTLTFAFGEKSKAFTVPIIDNAQVNSDKTINLTLDNPTGAIVLGFLTNAVVNIVDDETVAIVSGAGQFQFSASLYSVTENESTPGPYGPYIVSGDNPRINKKSAKGALITVTRTNGSTGRVMVDYQTVDQSGLAGIDYTNTFGTLTFDTYQMSTNFVVPVMSNYQEDGNKTVGLILSNPRPAPEEDPNLIKPTLGAGSVAVIEIIEVNIYFSDNVFNIERVAYRIDEYGDSDRPGFPAYRTNLIVDVVYPRGGPATTHVRLWHGPDTGYLLTAGSDFATGVPTSLNNPVYTDGQQDDSNPPDYVSSIDQTDGTDYVPVVFPNGWTRRHVVVPIRDDIKIEFNEDFKVELVEEPISPNPSGKTFPDGIEAHNGENWLATTTIMFDDQPAGALDREWNPDAVGGTTPPFNLTPGANNTVHSVAVQADGKTIIGGDFTAVNTVQRNGIARFNVNGSVDLSFNPGGGADGLVDMVLVDANQHVLMAGGFSAINNIQRSGIARLNPDGSLDTTFAPGNGADGRIRTMAVQKDGKIIIAGDFTTFNDINRNGLARLNADGSLDQTFNPGVSTTDPSGNGGTTIWTLALDDGGPGFQKIYLGGEFLFYQGNPSVGIARINPDASFDSTFDAGYGFNNVVYTLALQPDGRVVVGGAFSEINIYNRSGIARLNPSGTVDTTFTPGTGANDSIYTVKLQPDGKILIGGIFTSYNNTRRVGLARLKVDGTLDTTFLDTAYNQFAGLVNKFSFEPPNFVNSMALQEDGNIMIGGSFTQVGGNQSENAARPNYYEVFTRSSKRVRYNVARLIGGVTPGPGNMEFTAAPYRADENASYMSITLRRIDGLLGTIGTSISTTNRLALDGVDYTASGTNITWKEYPPGGIFRSQGEVGLKYLRVPITDDTLVEGDETVDLGLYFPTGSITLGGEYIPLGGALGVREETMTIVDNDFNRGIFNFGAPSYTVTENGIKATISVIRTNGSSGSVSVTFMTRAGRFPDPTPYATVGVDYVSTNGTLSFAPGQTNRTFQVNILQDQIVEFDENITLILTNATGGAKLPGGSAFSAVTNVLTIVDDDFAAGRLNFSSSTYTNKEDSGAALVTVTRTGGSVGAIAVSYRTGDGTATLADNDYITNTGTLTWNDGDIANKTFTVSLIGPDQKIEGVETMTNFLFNPLVNGLPNNQVLGGRTNATVFIQDADAFGTLFFSQPNYSIDENGAIANITVLRIGGIAGTVTVNYETIAETAVPGEDYITKTGTLTFSPGQSSTNFVISILDDAAVDGDKTVKLRLTNAVPASSLTATNTAILTIIDDESFSIPAGTFDSAFDQNLRVDNFVQSVALQPDGRFLIAGDFTNVNNFPAVRIARLQENGLIDTTFNAGTGANNSVRAILLQPDGKILMGGLFTVVSATNRNSIARLNLDGTVDAFFNPGAGANNPVYALALQSDDKVLIGGSFNLFNGVNRSGIARLNANGSIDTTFNPGVGINGVVYALAVQSADGKVLVGGSFTNFNGVVRNYFVRLNTDGSVDTTFPDLALNGAVKAILIQPDGKIVVGGSFTSASSLARGYVARFFANGVLDTSFLAGGLAGADNSVYTIAQQVDGKLVLGGDFTTFNGVTRNRLSRLINDGVNDGKTDPTINFGTGANGFIASLAIQPDRQILFGGGFTAYNEQPHKYIGRIHGGSIAGPGSLEYAAPIFTAQENSTNAVITVRRLGGTTGAVSVNYTTGGGTAVAGTDYVATSGQLVFPEGETRRTFTVPIIDNFVVNNDKSVGLSLSNFAGGVIMGPQAIATLNILNDESVISFNAAENSVNENSVSGNATITLIRTGAINTTVSANIATVSGGTATSNSDFKSTNATVTFLPGEVTKNFNIQIIDDLNIEGNETVSLTLSNPNPAQTVQIGLGASTLVIVDNDFGPGVVSLGAISYVVDESGPVAAIDVIRANGSSGVISVHYATGNGTALAGSDYVMLDDVLSFADGEKSKTINVPIINNSILESNETFTVTLSSPTGGASLGAITVTTVTILDDDAVIVAAGSALISESVSPTNNAIEPGETVRILFALRNAGRVNTSNVVATLQANSGVTAVTGAQSYGALLTNGPAVAREFGFTAVGTNGTRIFANLLLIDGTNNLGTVSFSYVLGQPTTLFSNLTAIVINDNNLGTPYPSTINVSGLSGLITRVNVTLKNLTHNYPDDIGVLLVGPNGQSTVLMANCGGNKGLNNVTLTFVDSSIASANLTDGIATDSPITNGSYYPTQYGFTTFPPSAPPAPYGNSLDVFKGTNPNGTWKLFVLDDLDQDAGVISGGWSIAVLSSDSLMPVADISTTATPSATTLGVGSDLTYTISVTNHGPAGVSNVRLTNAFSAAVSFKSSSVPMTTLNPRTMVANLGSLTNGGRVSFTFTVVPHVSGSLTNTVFAVGNENESNLANNTSVAITSITGSPALLILRNSGNLMVSWASSGNNFVLQTATNIPSINWANVTNAVVQSNGQYTVTIPLPTTGNRFYRLQLP